MNPANDVVLLCIEMTSKTKNSGSKKEQPKKIPCPKDFIFNINILSEWIRNKIRSFKTQNCIKSSPKEKTKFDYEMFLSPSAYENNFYFITSYLYNIQPIL